MPEKPSKVAEVSDVLAYLESQLIGPALGLGERLDSEELPSSRYTLAILHPKELEAGAVQAEQIEDQVAPEWDSDTEQPVVAVFQHMPASAGCSFFMVGDPVLSVEVSGAKYSLEVGSGKKKDGKWVHQWIANPDRPEAHEIKGIQSGATVRKTVLNGAADLHVKWRPMKGGWLVTATLINASRASGDRRTDASNCVFQAGMTCRPTSGCLSAYPAPRMLERELEEEELAMLYRGSPTWAIGHGCAAVWDAAGGTPRSVALSFLPHAEVKPVSTEPAVGALKYDAEVLSLQYLQNPDLPSADLKRSLMEFLRSYEMWFNLQQQQELPEEFKEAKLRNLERVAEAIGRMREGIDTVCAGGAARTAFTLANRAMLMQMVHAGEDYAGKLKERNEIAYVEPAYTGKSFRSMRWRPFQLAFQLLVIPSLMDPKRADRKVVDLLWFPTGGGKTEAYLALAAFEIFRRRLQGGNKGAGTAVLKRYTLRLLTSQQFQRAAGLICAMERIRVNGKTGLGNEPFTLGLWVGDGLSPNKFAGEGEDEKGAFEKFEAMREAEKPENVFQLHQCPWCGTRLVPDLRSDDLEDYGIRATTTSFSFHCPSDKCPFHTEIPVNVVDEHLFAHPPTFLIGTIDKFARLAWDQRARAFFGVADGGEQAADPPSLIIQDELHLISGPLGTISAIYEAAIDTAITSLGADPKIIAATATIRRAADQVQRLYAREHRQFPPSGTDSRDSYFARIDTTARGRVYTGLMAQGVTPVTSLVHTCAALCQSVLEMSGSEASLDTWWTQLIYHNSRRELGKTMTLARDDIPSRVKVIARDQSRMRSNPRVEELSGSVRGSRLPEVLEELKAERGSDGAIDILPCTSMISVGVDVKRLGLMVVNGQPKTTAEYIQASSRIGRDPSRPSGLVVVHYSWTKPRDRSHYENFFAYHGALYREVEPTSVTPCAPPALGRALHAALVIVARIAGGLADNDSAADFNPQDPNIVQCVARLTRRLAAAEPEESSRISGELNRLVREWQEYAQTEPGKPRLKYQSSGGKQFSSLLVAVEGGGSGHWPTLNSMRHVDKPSRIRLFGESDGS